MTELPSNYDKADVPGLSHGIVASIDVEMGRVNQFPSQ